MTVVTRFAPSPTGRLHLGHAYAAIRAHDHARRAGGRFLLRIEDIDGTRSREDHVAGILADLAWLGLAWDGPVVRQSTRLPAYAAALDRLRADRLLYPCFCTRADIAASASAPHHGPDGPVYPGTCRRLDAGVAAERVAAGVPHAWRLAMDAAFAAAGPLGWIDRDAGPQRAEPLAFGDVVLARKDAPASYHLAVTVDDAAQGVTDVVRGRDLMRATDVHRLLQGLLGLPTPVYLHHPLLVGADGERLAKRNGAAALADRRAAGEDGAALARSLRAGQGAPGAPPIGFAPDNA
ncbi:tRNA glutamyl-Q(34) synthetase GluQRS [Sphingomonas sp. A2-49]|uniref:tRNA glutamyl-Q(34) synthetase GluQRS n=1 Tax=Sphingomonas sp. A2-49 TaxID=1391375 RepID=UPI0021D1DB44|nr:tRNA glutamyl-Q(34) synthetase GluQRS [Sphingomonas sp. A2-49]MCU6454668.1 tRNA glutamyl-Q(34) synthetase GluQRS [Sphingomonas sp. A2-49]